MAPLLCVRRAPVEAPEGPAIAVSLRLPSDVACIEEAVALLTYHCASGTATDSRLRFRLQVVLAEAIANAILRGNRECRDKAVNVHALLVPDEVRIEVTDEGEGFDPLAVPEPLVEGLSRTDGRGLFLMRHLADAVAFNARGNSVCITLRRH